MGRKVYRKPLQKQSRSKKGWRRRYDVLRKSRNEKALESTVVKKQSEERASDCQSPENVNQDVSDFSALNESTLVKTQSEETECDCKSPTDVSNACDFSTLSAPRVSPLIQKLQDHLKGGRRKAGKLPAHLNNEDRGTSTPPKVSGSPAWSPYTQKAVQHLCSRGKKFRGRPLASQMQAAVWNVLQYCRLENYLQAPAIPYTRVIQRTAAMLRLSQTTVKKYAKVAKQKKQLLTPRKESNREFPKMDVDTMVRSSIECLIYDLHSKGARFTVGTLLEEIRRKDMGFEGGKETLRMLLRAMGFSYVKSDGTRYLKEKPEVQALRLTFLTKYVAIRQDLYLVFTDETWIFRQGTIALRAWENSDVRSCSSKVSGFGERYVVIAAGGRDGFIPGSIKVFPTKSNPLPGEDYHGDVTGDMWIKWARNDLLPNLPERRCAIILDNAAYHRIQANFSFVSLH